MTGVKIVGVKPARLIHRHVKSGFSEACGLATKQIFFGSLIRERMFVVFVDHDDMWRNTDEIGICYYSLASTTFLLLLSFNHIES